MFRIFFCQFNTFLPNFYIGRWKVAPHVHQATMLAPSAQIKTRKCITPYRTNGRHSQQEISLNNFSFQHVLFTEVYLEPYQTCLSGFYVNVSLFFVFVFVFLFFHSAQTRQYIQGSVCFTVLDLFHIKPVLVPCFGGTRDRSGHSQMFFKIGAL